ncbi:MAG: excinuclease ABC subunit UvrC [Geobacteraceae bacterium]
MLNSDCINRFPPSTGVYLMKGSDGSVLYVGKARDLKKRIRSYFSKARDSRYHIRFLMERVADMEYIVTDTEKEALILENTLIKHHRPRYNINLRDDKTYFSLRMDMTEEFPRLSIIRKVSRDGARYFGPYASSAAAREVLRQLCRIFPLRHYPLETCRQRKRPCLFYQLRHCSAPCFGLISREGYALLAEGAAMFLAGRNRDLLKVLKQRMRQASASERYEEAARLRNLIRSIEQTLEKQKMVSQAGDLDVLGHYRAENRLQVTLLFIRGGNLIGSRTYPLTWEMDDAEGIASFLNEYYSNDVLLPDEILLPLSLAGEEALAQLLTERRGRRVIISHPRRGAKLELVRLACKNAATAARDREQAAAANTSVLEDLRERLHLARIPRRIECYDISNIQGRQAVGSRVSFLDGRPDKAHYRHYRIRSVDQSDDLGMMREVLARRFRDGPAGSDYPDLIVVDGGTGQLNVLSKVLGELGVTEIAAASLAKSRVEREMAAEKIRRSDERVFLPGRKNPVVMRQNSAPLLLLAQIRDEAHRFAITYHRKLRGKEFLSSQLEEAPGVGPGRKLALLRHFGSLQRVREATVEELMAVKGISRQLAEAIQTYFHPKET